MAIKDIARKLLNFKNYPGYLRRINPFFDIWGRIKVGRLLHLRRFNRLAYGIRRKLQPYYQEYISNVSKDDQAISLELAVFLFAVCDILKPEYIADFGSGFSSFVLRFYMKSASNKPVVFSVDDSPEWLSKTNSFLTKQGVPNDNLMDWDDFIKHNEIKFDLILNDFSAMGTRRQRLREILSKAAHNGIVILDDMHKPDFAQFVRQGLKGYGFKHYSLKLFTEDKFGRYSTILFPKKWPGNELSWIKRKEDRMNIASTLLWLLGILNFLGGIALGIPQIAQGKSAVFPFYIFILGIAACISGYFLRKKQRTAAIAAIVVSVLLFVSPPLIGLILGIIIIILVTMKWKELS